MNVSSIGRGISVFGKAVSERASAVGRRVCSVFGTKTPVIADKVVFSTTPKAAKVAKLVAKYEAQPVLKQAIINGALKQVPAAQQQKFLSDVFRDKFVTVFENLIRGKISPKDYEKMAASFNSKVEKSLFGKTIKAVVDHFQQTGKLIEPDALNRIFEFMQKIGASLS